MALFKADGRDSCNVRGTGINPRNFGRIHIQIRPNGRRHAHDTALKKRLLANRHRGRQNEQTLLNSRVEAFRPLRITRLLVDCEAHVRTLFPVVCAGL